MQAAYARWLVAKLITGKPPLLTLEANVRIGGWISFSEYWSLQGVLPRQEGLYIKRCLEGRQGRAMAFDVGANIGAFTCFLAEMGARQVHAFEPIPETFCRLKNNVKLNGLLDRAHLNCLAVGMEQGFVTFHIEESSPATNHMALPGRSSANSVTSSQLVALVSLDGYCNEQGIQGIDFLKVDVEGMEPYVLQGARALLRERRIAAILIEICPANLRAVGLSPAHLYREFEAVRYSPHVLNDDGRPGDKLAPADIEAMTLANVVLLPDA
jgi:FkbM family methyltransferase